MAIQNSNHLIITLPTTVLRPTEEKKHIKAIYNTSDPDKNIQTNETQGNKITFPALSDVTSTLIRTRNLNKYTKLVQDICKIQGISGIDIDSIENIALALKYLKIKSMETIIEMDLKIIKPGPLFYTWTALNGKSLYNGQNNKRGINYISSLKKECELLSSNEIPIFIVFSERNGAPSYVSEMEAICRENNDAIFISLENDLNMLEGYDEYIEQTTDTLTFNDSLRQFVIFNYKQILDICKLQCSQKNKLKLLRRFNDIGYDSITYTDFDNIHLNPIGYSLAKHGMHSCPCVNIGENCKFIKRTPSVYEDLNDTIKLTMNEILLRCEYLPSIGKLCTKSNSWYEISALKLYNYIGKLNVPALLMEMQSSNRTFGREDNGYLRISYESLLLYKSKVSYKDLMVKLLTEDEFKECDLVVYQNMKKLLIGRNATWLVS